MSTAQFQSCIVRGGESASDNSSQLRRGVLKAARGFYFVLVHDHANSEIPGKHAENGARRPIGFLRASVQPNYFNRCSVSTPVFGLSRIESHCAPGTDPTRYFAGSLVKQGE